MSEEKRHIWSAVCLAPAGSVCVSFCPILECLSVPKMYIVYYVDLYINESGIVLIVNNLSQNWE